MKAFTSVQTEPAANRNTLQCHLKDGTVSQIKLNTGEMADMSENNRIRRVEMIGPSVPYHFNSSWGPVLSGK